MRSWPYNLLVPVLVLTVVHSLSTMPKSLLGSQFKKGCDTLRDGAEVSATTLAEMRGSYEKMVERVLAASGSSSKETVRDSHGQVLDIKSFFELIKSSGVKFSFSEIQLKQAIGELVANFDRILALGSHGQRESPEVLAVLKLAEDLWSPFFSARSYPRGTSPNEWQAFVALHKIGSARDLIHALRKDFGAAVGNNAHQEPGVFSSQYIRTLCSFITMYKEYQQISINSVPAVIEAVVLFKLLRFYYPEIASKEFTTFEGDWYHQTFEFVDKMGAN